MTIRIAPDLGRMAATAATGATAGTAGTAAEAAEQPADGAFSQALQAKLRSAETAEAARATAARSRQAEHRSPAHAGRTNGARPESSAGGAHRSAEAAERSRAAAEPASSPRPQDAATHQAQAAAVVAQVASTPAAGSDVAGAGQTTISGVAAVGTSVATQALADAATADLTMAATSVAAAQLSIGTTAQQVAVGQGSLAPEIGAAQAPVATAALVPSVVPAGQTAVVPSMSTPTATPTVPALAVPLAESVAAAEPGALSRQTLVDAADALAAKTAPVAPALPDADPVSAEMRASAFGGVATGGARPYADAGDVTAGFGAADAAATTRFATTTGAAPAAPVTVQPVATGSGESGSGSVVALTSLGQAATAAPRLAGQADGASGASDPALPTTPASPTSPASSAAPASATAAPDSTGTPVSGQGATPASSAVAPVIAQHVATRAVVASVLGEASSAALSGAEPVRSDTIAGSAERATAPVLAPPVESQPPAAPPAQVVAAPAHAPAVTSAHPTVPAQAAAPPPAVHSQILTAVTPVLNRRDGSYSVELQLDPASLGRVRVHLAIASGEVSLHLASGDAGTRDMLRQNLDQLRQQLADSGFGRSSLDVGDGSSNAWQQAADRQAARHGDAQRATHGGLAGETTLITEPSLRGDASESSTRSRTGDGPLDVRI
ncbi:MAG: flagellar hook-length control protein FliK [Actinobacteria bacterium]|nr:flagellar hook-length control protein FliK [Actinomycetota bacterium]